MLINEYLTDSSLLSDIQYLADNEADNITIIYNWIIGNYGSRTTAPITETITDKAMLGSIINLMYSDKWKTLKNAILADIDITGTTNKTTTTINNSIYGYNGDNAKDYTNVREKEEVRQYNNIFEMIEKNIEFRKLLSYYNVVVADIVDAISLSIYE